MTLSHLHLIHRHEPETWSRRLMVTVFVAAGSLMRFSGGEHRAAIDADPYDGEL